MHALHRIETLRRIEAAWCASLPPGTLMRRAAAALADAVASLARTLPRGAPVVSLVGPGNNGGDAILALALLRDRGFRVRALALGAGAPAAVDAQAARAGWIRAGGEFGRLEELPDWVGLGAVFIDGLFGIGLARPLSDAAAEAVRALRPAWRRVVSVDVPSGLDAWTGRIVGGSSGVAVQAAVTVTMIGDKPGLRTGSGRELAGRVVVADLGLAGMPDGTPCAADGHLFGAADAAECWRPRGDDTHKGSFGSLVVVGGAAGTTGAALLAALGAQACGAGRVWIASPDDLVFDPGQPQLMTRAIDAPFDPMDALCVGCGLGVSPAARSALARALAAPRALVLDADALNLLSGDPDLLHAAARRSEQTLLTPHPLEAARLLGTDTATIQSDRVAWALALAQRLRATVLLKGAGTVAARPDGRWAIVGGGSNALATAGTGDVLAGMAAALLAQGYPAWNAARLASWLHGSAGDGWHATHPAGAGLTARRLPELVIERLQCLVTP